MYGRDINLVKCYRKIKSQGSIWITSSLCFDLLTDRPSSSICAQMRHHLWFKSQISGRRMRQTVRFNLNARCCARFGQENGASEGETHAINACCINWQNSQGRLCINSYFIQTRVTKTLQVKVSLQTRL